MHPIPRRLPSIGRHAAVPAARLALSAHTVSRHNILVCGGCADAFKRRSLCPAPMCSVQEAAFKCNAPPLPPFLSCHSNEKYQFPGQQEVVDFCVRQAMAAVVKQPRTLIVVGTYSIGKERVFTGTVAEHTLGSSCSATLTCHTETNGLCSGSMSMAIPCVVSVEHCLSFGQRLQQLCSAKSM